MKNAFAVLFQLWPFFLVGGVLTVFGLVGLFTTITWVIEWASDLWDLRKRRKAAKAAMDEPTVARAVVKIGGDQ